MSCTLITTGRVGNVETRQVGERTVTRFSVATSTYHKDSKGDYLTEWTHFDAWNKTGEYIAKNVQKGDVVEVQAEKFTREKDGKYFTNYTVTKFDRIAKGKASESGQAAPAAAAAAPTAQPTVEDDEIPF